MEPFPGYRLRRFLGRGGFGEVWEAVSPDGDALAFKFLPCGAGASAAQESRSLQIVSQLQHPNLIRISRVWCYPGYVAIAMELADGTLMDLLEAHQANYGEPLASGVVIPFLAQAARALDFLNTRQHRIDGQCVAIQHCDINPRNILLFGETVKLSDFGLTSITTSVMKSHRRAGTLDFSAPEIFQGRLSDRSDQYALAVTYCLLRGGRLPFSDTPASFERIYARPPPDLSMLLDVERPILARALAPAPLDRWPSCGELMSALAQAVDPQAPKTIPLRRGRTRGAPSVLNSERRGDERHPCGLPTSGRQLGRPDDESWTARIRDVSQSGLGLALATPFKQGTVLAINVAGDHERFARPVLVRVVHVKEQAGGEWIVGCNFVGQLSQAELDGLLRSHAWDERGQTPGADCNVSLAGASG